MPRGDRTGPDGWGPMTGRRLGFCTGYAVPGFMTQSGFGFGRGRGGRGPRGAWSMGFSNTPRSFAPPVYPIPEQTELNALRQQAEYLTQTMDEINRRISELEAQKDEN